MFKALFFSMLMILSSQFLFSQSFFGAKIAGGIANVTDGTQSIGPKFGLQLGGVITHNFNSWFALQGEALYSLKGAEGTAEGITFAYNFNYLEIPILAKFKVGTFGANFSRVNLNAGLYNAFKLSGEVKVAGETFDASGLESHDLGLVIGTDAFISRNLNLDIRYNLGITNLAATGTLKNIGLLLGITYYFE